VHKVGF